MFAGRRTYALLSHTRTAGEYMDPSRNRQSKTDGLQFLTWAALGSKLRRLRNATPAV